MKKEKFVENFQVFMFVFIIFMMIIHAWLCDDAFISFRVVKNFVAGCGLRWNTFERVQVFTNPLTVLSLIPLYAITKEIFYTSMFFNVITSTVAIYILMFKICKNKALSIVLAIFLLGSKSFMSFTTSGLENSVTFMLLAIFYYFFFKRETYEKKDILILSLTGSLVLLNRMDSILLIIPSYVYVFLKRNKEIGIFKFILYFIIGMVPFMLWEMFSLIYYGFFLPNTYYAKLNTGIPKIEFILNGIKYIDTILLLDPATIVIIILGLFFIFITDDSKNYCTLIGAIISIIYIIYVGGDFMLGRFLTPALFTIIIGFTRLNINDFNTKAFKISFIIALVVFLGFKVNYQLTLSDLPFTKTNGIADERAFYFTYSSLFNAGSEKTLAKTKFFEEKVYTKKVSLASNIGFMGYFKDPDSIIIDNLALSDPFLSRVPINSAKLERIGHNVRTIPNGYMETIINGQNMITNKNLSQYYEVIKTITQDDIFSTNRLKTIIKYHLGKYDYLINDYMNPSSKGN